MLDTTNPFCIAVKDGNNRVPIQYIPPQTSRTLVGVSVNLAHDIKVIIPLFQEKIAQYIVRLATCLLLLSLILAGYNSFW